MQPATDPHRRFRLLAAAQIGACVALTLLAAAWAWRVRAPVLPAPVPDTATTQPATAPVPDAAAWRVALWRPASDAPPPAPPRIGLSVFSILHQGDGYIAAIAATDAPGLVYVRAGDDCHGWQVVRVEADGVILRADGREQRLGMTP
jgi:hypothetical protein